MQWCYVKRVMRWPDGRGYFVDTREGHTDGRLHYYCEMWGKWHAIDPDSGTSITTGATLEEAQANAKKMMNRVREYKKTPEYKAKKDRFRELMVG